MFTVIINQDKKSYITQYATYQDAKDYYDFVDSAARADYLISLTNDDGEIIESR